MVSGIVALFLLPHIGQDTIDSEDIKFREYLMANGYDTSTMGLASESTENIVAQSSDEGRMNEKAV